MPWVGEGHKVPDFTKSESGLKEKKDEKVQPGKKKVEKCCMRREERTIKQDSNKRNNSFVANEGSSGTTRGPLAKKEGSKVVKNKNRGRRSFVPRF